MTRDVIVVDTALAPGVVEQSGCRTLLGSDNEAWEFSAIDTEAVAPPPFDVITGAVFTFVTVTARA